MSHSFETHNQIQEREAQLLKVNEQVKSYQSKCKAAEQMLNKKDHMIADLQKQVRQLNKKVLKISFSLSLLFTYHLLFE